jgi:transcriptional regulator with XRE-family HTH domain
MNPPLLVSADPSSAPLQVLGAQIRSQRKALRLSATVVAEAAGVSRVTLHRIEKGRGAVTMGAWHNTLAALGMSLQMHSAANPVDATGVQQVSRVGWIPSRVRLADYPQLRALAWQVHGTDTLTPVEALDIYERNARHLDMQAMPTAEKDLLQALRLALSRSPHPLATTDETRHV